MQKPSFSTTISLGNWLTIGTIVVAGLAAFFQMQAAIGAMDVWRVEYDKRLEKLEVKVSPIEGITFRMGQQEASMSAINARVDRAVDAITDQLKELRKDVGSVNTSIAVLTRSIDARSQRGDDLGTPSRSNGPR